MGFSLKQGSCKLADFAFAFILCLGIKFPAICIGYPQVSMLKSNFNVCIFSKFHTGAELVSRGVTSNFFVFGHCNFTMYFMY